MKPIKYFLHFEESESIWRKTYVEIDEVVYGGVMLSAFRDVIYKWGRNDICSDIRAIVNHALNPPD